MVTRIEYWLKGGAMVKVAVSSKAERDSALNGWVLTKRASKEE